MLLMAVDLKLRHSLNCLGTISALHNQYQYFDSVYTLVLRYSFRTLVL